jgi:hypothetical protein
VNDAIRKFLQLSEVKEDLQKKMDEVTKDLVEVSRLIAEDFAVYGVQSVNLDGWCVYSRVDTYVGRAESDSSALVAALRENEDWSDLVSAGYNPAQLKSRVLETIDRGDQVPGEIFQHLKINHVASVRRRKS